MIISVKDNGIGIKKKNLESIFEKYYRVENKTEGSGIGLYLVKEIVNNSGGKIIVNSTSGSGTEFQVSLKSLQQSSFA
jgi:signal transduction histidine kinase